MPTILYVDDDSDDCEMLHEYVRETGVPAEMVYAANGEEAIQYISQKAEKLPDVVILDMNMPKMSGMETLRYLKKHPLFSRIPVFMLSTSDNHKDMERCRQEGAQSYFVKPYIMAGYAQIINACRSFLGIHPAAKA